MSELWYALRSKPRKEEVLWRQCRSRGYETFLPRIRINPVNPRARKLVPYFPGYMFVYTDLQAVGRSEFQWMPHSMGLVSFGGEPASVPDNLIHSLSKRIEAINAAGGELFEDLKPGDVVRISDGPFRGYEAIFDQRISGSERVRVLLELLGNQRRVPVELHSGLIEKKKP
ncbi:MAG: transcription termination/antitermination NusG family protein [Anaerolineales bacterium]|jgi:transcription antitermination factor NusG